MAGPDGHGVKLKPWGAPPVRGVFAIAFEIPVPDSISVVQRPHLVLEVSEIDSHNVATQSTGQPISTLVYRDATLVTFIPHSDAFAVSFEQVGVADNGQIRGFLVMRTSVGFLRQTVVNAQYPAGTDVNTNPVWPVSGGARPRTPPVSRSHTQALRLVYRRSARPGWRRTAHLPPGRSRCGRRVVGSGTTRHGTCSSLMTGVPETSICDGLFDFTSRQSPRRRTPVNAARTAVARTHPRTTSKAVTVNTAPCAIHLPYPRSMNGSNTSTVYSRALRGGASEPAVSSFSGRHVITRVSIRISASSHNRASPFC